MALKPGRSCFSALERNSKQSVWTLPSSGRSLYTASSVATTSRVTLSGAQSWRDSIFTTSLVRSTIVMPFSWNKKAVSYSPNQSLSLSRGMATITRQPVTPEEPAVFSGGEAPSIILTDRAIQHLAKVSAKEKNPDLALRIAVEPGGCHGYQYKMEITNEIEEDDFRFSSGDNVHLVIDSTSLRLIKGSTIDYVTELIGSQFAILNNPQAKGAGCGCGVSWEPIV